MSREDEILQELIAQREKLNDMIKSYQEGNGELSAVVPTKETKPKEVSFEELLERSVHDEDLCTVESSSNRIVYAPNVKVYNYNVNVDYSHHETTNHESHTNTTLAGGDKVIDAIGGIFNRLFE